MMYKSIQDKNLTEPKHSNIWRKKGVSNVNFRYEASYVYIYGLFWL